jgi:hypothetical protein
MTKNTAVRELYEAARFSLAVHLSASEREAGERLATERLTRALVGVNCWGGLHNEQSDGEVNDGRVG